MKKVTVSKNVENGIDYYRPFVGGCLVLVLAGVADDNFVQLIRKHDGLLGSTASFCFPKSGRKP
jgi:hypothetical protein